MGRSVQDRNFEHMPESHSHYGYHTALGAIVLIGGVLAVCFRRRDWL
jgi:Mg2+ and Co2+ transporter CorA